MRKKILAVVLSLAVVLAYMPGAAFTSYADTSEGLTGTTATDSVAVASADALQQALEAGSASIELTGNISADRTFYVTSDTTIFSSGSKTITRASGFTGDIFVVGEDKNQNDVIGDLGKDSVEFNLGKSGSSDSGIVLDGNSVTASGTAIFVMNSSTVNLYEGVEVKNFIKTGNSERTARSGVSKETETGGAAAIVSSGSLNIRGAKILNNGVAAAKDAYSSLGGAIYNFGTVKMYSGTLSGNTAAYGGAIYNYRTVKLYNGTLSGNNAIYGGAIAQASSQYAQTVVGNSSACGSGVLFQNNGSDTLTSCGGAIYASNKDGVGNTGISVYSDAKAVFDGNASMNYGGAIYTYGAANIRGAEFKNNRALKDGGAIQFKNGGNEPVLSGCTFTGNIAGSQGGAIYEESGMSMTIKDDCSFIDNEAGTSAGAIYVEDNNSAKTYITVKDSTFQGNKALGTHGGAMYIYKNAVADIRGCKFISNAAVENGGALYINAAEVKMTSADFTDNSVASTVEKTGNGGAIGMYSGAVAYIDNSTFEGNSASYRGGAAYIASDNTELNLYNSTFTSNTAANYGGGVSFTTGTLGHLYKTDFNGNSGSSGSSAWFYNNVSSPIVYGCTANGAAASTDITQIRVSGNAPVYYAADAEISYVEAGIPQNPFDSAVIEEDPVDADSVQAIFDIGEKSAAGTNFNSRATASYDISGVGNVKADTFVYQPGNAANNPNVGEGLLIYQAMKYKKAHPDKDVHISISSYRFSPETAVCLDRTSSSFGSLKSLTDAEVDNGFVRIAYLLVSAAKMGIDVDVIAQREATGDATLFNEYFAAHMNDKCDSAYASGKVKDYLECVKSEWDYTNKSATDLMHTKACAVSAYIDKDGTEHGPSVWLSSSNLDNVKSDGRNGYDALQTGIIISDHQGIYRTTVNYLDLVKQHSSHNGVYEFRNLVNKMGSEQVDKLDAGQAIDPAEQIVYRDDVFELYFSAIGGDNAKWDETYNCMDKQIRNMYNSDDYIWFGMNNPKYDSFALGDSMQKLIAKAFNSKKNKQNRIDVNIGTGDEGEAGESSFDTSAYAGLTAGTDIAVCNVSSNDYSPIHSKDMLISYSKDGKRSYVSLITSMNMHEGSASYQSNFALVVKEKNCNAGSVFRTVGDYTMKNFLPADISVKNASVESATFDGTAKTPKVTVDGVASSEYDVAYENNINAGTAKAIITGKNGYTGMIEKEFTISQADISTLDMTVGSQMFTGDPVTPVPEISLGSYELQNGTDYEISYENNVEAGTATATVAGKGNFKGSKTVSFNITAKSLEGGIISDIPDQTYTGSAIEPSFTVTVDGEVLDSDEYKVSYSDNVNKGTCTLTVTGIGSYSGTLTKTFNILQADMSAVSVQVADCTYTGSAATPGVKVVYRDKELASEDYSVSYSNNINAGTATATVTGKGNFKGSKAVSFSIRPVDISAATVSGVKDLTYTGSALTQSVTITAQGVALTATDYDVAYANNVNAGTAKMTITGKKNASGTKTVEFTINRADIGDAVPGSISAKTYTGFEIKPTTTFIVGGKTLVNGVDYDLSYENNKEPGSEALVIASGKGNYKGDAYAIFTIKKGSIAKATVTAIPDKTYTGKTISPTVTVKLNGNTLKKGTHYSVTYSNNKNVGKATVTIKGLKGFSGTSIKKTFKINPKGTTIKSPTGSKKAFTAKWTKVSTKMSTSRISGYQVRYSTSSKMTSAKTVTVSGYSKTSKKISKLKAKKYYYVQVRTYKTVSGTKYYSDWSSTKKVKTK